jgi:hypothetical protein
LTWHRRSIERDRHGADELENLMTRKHRWIEALAVLVLGAMTPLSGARADFEVTGPDGRRILLKDDGTWRFQDTGREEAKDKPTVTGEGVLTLERRTEVGPNCRFGLRLTNNTNFEIENIVPSFSVYRTSGVLFETRSLGFFSIKPGNGLYREVTFAGITCNEIARLQVSGGDRCVIGDLNQFTHTGGACLERVRVVPSDLVRFDK